MIYLPLKIISTASAASLGSLLVYNLTLRFGFEVFWSVQMTGCSLGEGGFSFFPFNLGMWLFGSQCKADNEVYV